MAFRSVNTGSKRAASGRAVIRKKKERTNYHGQTLSLIHILNTDTSVSEIADLVGFQSIHYFSRFFKAKENCTPMEYRMRNGQSRYFNFQRQEMCIRDRSSPVNSAGWKMLKSVKL